MIYAASIMKQSWVKIRFSEEETCLPRLAQLQTGNPFEITLLFRVEGTLRQEQSLHSGLRAAFARIRLPMPPNEWYPGKHPVFQGFLEHLNFGFDAAFTYITQYGSTLKQPGKGAITLLPNYRWAGEDKPKS